MTVGIKIMSLSNSLSKDKWISCSYENK